MKAAARTSIAGGHTVVALAGATGSGKSSLFNDLIGADVAPIGARRPTTSTPIAAIWGSDSASALLDWLKVGARHMVDKRPSGATGPGVGPTGPTPSVPVLEPMPGLELDGLELDGLVLLDLPDFDSLEATHRVEADRLLDLVDVFIWVTDPQKYADARLHEDYIAKLSAHDAVTMVVLNQADLLTPETLAACRSDLLRLLEADGVDAAEVIATSATDGSGVIDLHHRISSAVAGQNAAVRRLDSDLRAAATVLRSGVADSEPSLGESDNAGRRAQPRGRHTGHPGRRRAGLSARDLGPHRLAVHPLGQGSASCAAEAAPVEPGRGCPLRRYLGVRRPFGARPVIPAARDSGCALGCGAGHPGAGGPGRPRTAAGVDRRGHECCDASGRGSW